jgi:serine O-acetyltransferase
LTLPALDTTDTARTRTFFANEKRLARLVREDWDVHFRDWTQPGFRAIAVHRFGTWVNQLRRGLVRSVLLRVHRAMFRYVRNHYGIELPASAVIGRRVIIGHQSGIVIHANAVIGDECFLRQNVTIGAATLERGGEAPTLGRGVSLGCGAVILGGVTIGDRVKIGPNAVVMIDVPADTSVFVNTPRMLKLVKTPATQLQDPESRLAGRER